MYIISNTLICDGPSQSFIDEAPFW